MKQITLILITLGFLFLSANTNTGQIKNNQLFLEELDKNILSTIQVLEAFNNNAKNLYDIEGADYYRRFLMDMTLECGKIRNLIMEGLRSENNEDSILPIILTIRSDIKLQKNQVTLEMDKQNREQLATILKDANQKISMLRKKIIEEEKEIVEIQRINKTYLGYHSYHFLYSLLQDYISVSDYLSIQNRDYLKQIVMNIIDSL
jgi:hypothetical protein